MKIGIFGTGMAGKTLAEKLFALEYDVMIGTRDIAKTLYNADGDIYGGPPFKTWIRERPDIKLGTFADAAIHGELLINAVSGTGTIPALKKAGKSNLRGKVLIDISNPLDFSKGMPPPLFVSNTDSLGEQIQQEFPKVKVVKTLNTMNAYLMANPGLVPGDHNVFLCGNDEDAKAVVKKMLKKFGWKEKLMIDLGDISGARSTEQMLPVWLRLWGKLQHPMFNFNVVVGRPL
jgi:8-hydroxy-5-deazaflavin:NADPH oxidoreductase